MKGRVGISAILLILLLTLSAGSAAFYIPAVVLGYSDDENFHESSQPDGQEDENTENSNGQELPQSNPDPDKNEDGEGELSQPEEAQPDVSAPDEDSEEDSSQDEATEDENSAIDEDIPIYKEMPPLTEEDKEQLGNWTSYNGVIFEDADIYQSMSGGGLAIGGATRIHNNYHVGSTYYTEYDPTMHIGQYTNEEERPALLLGGDVLEVDSGVSSLQVTGGAVVMTQQLLDVNAALPTGFTPQRDAYFQAADSVLLNEWFDRQYELARATSELMLLGNNTRVPIEELSNGNYLSTGIDAYRNQFFEVKDSVYQNALFINVETGSNLDLGSWWPVHSIIYMDMDWVLDSDLVIFNFPDAVNVTLNSSSFQIVNMEHWSTTVDAWVGERGMEERLALAEKVVYNFPIAQSIEANQALIQGTILAPDAAFTGIGFGDSGHIYGHLIARSYIARGNFTIHAFALTHWVYDIVEDAVNNRTDTGSIRLRHYLYFNGEPTTIRAEGGSFVLETRDGAYFDGNGGFTDNLEAAGVYTTNTESYTYINDVPLGDYTLVKIAATDGFALNETDQTNSHTYVRHPVEVEHPHETVSVLRYSEPAFIDLYFQKIDMETHEGLPGAVFTIVREKDGFQDATVGGTYTSDEDGLFVSAHVPAGVYHLVEVQTPEGYELVEGGELRFMVVWDEEAEQLVVQDMHGQPLAASKEYPLFIPNSRGGGQNTVLLVKYARETDDPETFYTLAGAGFSLFRYEEERDLWTQVFSDSHGEDIEIVTNEFGYYRVDNLPDGRYRIVETEVPAGYRLTNRYADDAFPDGYAYEFQFTEDVSYYTAYIPNTAMQTDLSVLVNGEILGETKPLAGAAFRLEHLLDDGKTWEDRVDTGYTDGNGEFLTENLTVGTYRLTQLQGARGFGKLEPASILFTIGFSAEDGTIIAQALYDGEEVSHLSSPVSLHTADKIFITIQNDANTCDYLVYKIDGDYRIEQDEAGDTVFRVTFLEDARFCLRRRQSERGLWQEYGDRVTSGFVYDQDGEPIRDSYGNHVAAARFEGLLYGDYQLLEMQPPDGFHSSSDIEIQLNDGSIGYQLHLFTITERMAETGQLSSYTAANYADKHSMDISFRLVEAGSLSKGLYHGEFALYQCEEDHIHDTELTPESCWAKSTPVVTESENDGLVVFHDLVTGTYLLRQDQAPVGYRLPVALWFVHVDTSANTFDISLVQGASIYDFQRPTGEDAEWLLPNWTVISLPITGGGGTGVYLLGGAAVLIAAITIKLLKRNEK